MRRFDEDEDEDVVIASRFVYRPGAITHARVTAVTGDKAILELAAPSYELLRQDAREKGPFPGVLGFAALPHLRQCRAPLLPFASGRRY